MDDEHDPVDVHQRLRATPALIEAVRSATGDELAVQRWLRSEYPDELVRAALALVDARRRAVAKFSRADDLWFDRIGLEQATPERVAHHKAGRFEGLVHDWCCGIGADAVALAAHGCTVRAIDLDPLRAAFTRWNAEALGVASNVEVSVADVTTLVDRDGLLHVDPDRRAGGRRRTIRIEEMTPDLDQLRTWIDEFRGGAIKLSPASNFQDKFHASATGIEIELVSLGGECKEATVWFGDLAGEDEWRATVLGRNPDEMFTLAGDPLGAFADPAPLGAFLYDPDPAVVRAGLVDVLAETAGLERLDDAEEYLTSETPVATPFARAFEVLAEVPNNNRAIRSAVREAGFGRVEIKCRHVPIDADAIRRRLPLAGHEPGVLVFARIAGRTRVVVARRVEAEAVTADDA